MVQGNIMIYIALGAIFFIMILVKVLISVHLHESKKRNGKKK